MASNMMAHIARRAAVPYRRTFSSRAQMETNLARLQELANTVSPAAERHQFERRAKVVCTIARHLDFGRPAFHSYGLDFYSRVLLCRSMTGY